VHVELQLHQELVAERLDEIGRVGRAAHVADFDASARRLAERGLVRLGVEARQCILDRAQRLEHLSGQKIFGAPLRFGDSQHAPGTRR